MRLDGFFALKTGAVSLPDGEPATLEVHELGVLRVSSGRLAVCDTIWLEAPDVLPVPPGDYRAVATIARVAESYDLAERREAYLSLLISDRPTVSVHPAVFEAGSVDWREQPAGGLAGVPGLCGVTTSSLSSIAMVDAEAIEAGMPADADTWYDTIISPSGGPGWFSRMDTNIDGPLGSLLTELPEAKNGENIAILMARAERSFPVLETRDAEGRMTGIHIDLLVIGELSESLQAFDGQSKYAAEFAAEAEEVRLQANREASSEGRGLFARIGRFFNP